MGTSTIEPTLLIAYLGLQQCLRKGLCRKKRSILGSGRNYRLSGVVCRRPGVCLVPSEILFDDSFAASPPPIILDQRWGLRSDFGQVSVFRG